TPISYSNIAQLDSSYFVLQCSGDTRDLHSFPTRRSSDLCNCMKTVSGRERCIARRWTQKPISGAGSGRYGDFSPRLIGFQVVPRSEEHTSELQSRENLVCRLLLEKKKKKNKVKCKLQM